MKLYRYIVFLLFMLGGFCAKAVDQPPVLIRACLSKGNDTIVTLNWQAPTDACGSFQGYYIYGREDAFQPFILIDSVKTLGTQTTQFKIPNRKAWTFYIEIKYLCDGVSTDTSNLVTIDLVPPSLTDIDSVSVDLATQRAIVGWSANPTPDLMGYRVYKYEGTSNNTLVDTNSTSCIDNTRDPNDSALAYRIAPFDSCRNFAAISPAPGHKTIFLRNSYDSCKRIVNLSWTAYIGWATSNYQVWADTNNSGTYVLVATVPGGTLQYAFNAIPGRTYRFFVRALKQGSSITSSSNLTSRFIRVIIDPAFNYLSSVSVIGNEDIRVRWFVDLNAEMSYFYIRRSLDSVNFVTIDSVMHNSALANREYIDVNVDVQNQKYFYQIEAYNVCRRLLIKSNISNNIVLKITAATNINTLDWNPYYLWPTGVEAYWVNRGYDPGTGSTWNIISIENGTTYQYIDNNPPDDLSNGGVCYEVIAQENPGNPFNIKDSSRSNQVCAVLEPKVYFPNAFRIKGVNDKFLPKGIYINWAASEMHIYNRWGELIFETTRPDLGWDGTHKNGGTCQEGVYYYTARIKGSNGKVIQSKGTITLLY